MVKLLISILFVAGCSSMSKNSVNSRMPSSTPDCVPPTQSCSLGQKCRPISTTTFANFNAEGGKSIFREGASLSFLVERLSDDEYRFVSSSPVGRSHDSYAVWSDSNRDGVLQSDEITRPEILTDVMASRFSFNRVANYYDVDVYGNSITNLITGINRPWSIFSYQAQACSQNTSEQEQGGEQTAP